MRDIDYFTKSQMDQYLSLNFCDRLPSGRIRDLFNEAISVFSLYTKAYENFNLLHYKLTKNYGGVTQIELQYDIPATFNFLPIFGNILWFHKRVLNPNPYIYIYFDTATGEMLSQSEEEFRRIQNISAENHFEAGKKIESEGKYQQAYEEFHKAYEKCSRNYVNENKFLQHRDRAKDEVDSDALIKEGDRLLLRGDLTTALSKFQAALNKTHTRKQSILNKIPMEKNKLAEKHFERGNSLENQGYFEEAFREYETAFQICTTNYQGRNVFEEHYNKMRNEVNAAAIQNEAEVELSCTNLTLALEKFQAAHDMTVKNKDFLSHKIAFAKTEISISAIKNEGDVLFAEGKYTQALEKYTTALNQSDCSSMKSLYASLVEAAEDELSAIDEFQRGYAEFEAGDYMEAKQHFINAHSGTKSEKTIKVCEEMLDLTNTEIDALEIQQTAQNAIEDNDYGKAITLLKSAIFKSKHSLNQQKLQAELDLVRNELDIKEIVLEAIQFFDQRKYVEATKMYEEARNKATQEERQEKLEILQQQCSNEAKAQKLAKEGDELHKQSKLLQALEKYQKALEISSVETEKCAYATLVIKVQEEVKQDLIKRADETFDKFNEETNVAIEKVYQLISGFKDFHAVTEISVFIKDLRKHFDSGIHRLDSIQMDSNNFIQNNPDETPKEELLDLIKLRIKEGSVGQLKKAGKCILELLSADSDKTFIKLRSVLVGFDKIGDENEVSTIKQRLRNQCQTHLEQINSIQTLAYSNRLDLTSHYVARANKQADEQQETVRMLNNQ